MKKTVAGGLLSLALVAVLLAPQAHAETTSTNSADQLKALMEKLAELQAQLAALQGQVQSILKSNITEGTSSDDVKKVQELLASDPTIYPEGKVTGYFGGLTKEAIKRFQKRHELPETGVVDEETKALMEEYLKERTNGQVPPGLLRAPGIMKKVEGRMEMKCDNSGSGKGMGPLCQRLKMEQHHDEDEMDTEDHEDMMGDDHHKKMMGKDRHGKMMKEEDENMEDENDDDSSDSADATYRDAIKAIQKAEKMIAKAQREVSKTDSDTDEAKALIKKARMTLGEARTEKAAADYATTVELAEKAENTAEEAYDSAKNADEDDENDDDEDEDEDSDDDEDAEDDSEDDD